MDRQLIWAVKSQNVAHTRKQLALLSEREDLFDISSINTKSREYRNAVANFEKAERTGCSIVTYIDDLYPESLRQISQPPPILYVRGNAKILSKVVYAGIVGARETDDYGIRVAENIAMEIGETGAGIASGGARGIDAASHRGALRAKAPTVAVLGSGLDNPYPKENIPLFRSIVENGGAVITEYPFGALPLQNHFPRRNRIIAGLSSALVVVRAAKKSGSLITASQALNQGLSIFAVPGNIDNGLSFGTNELIRDGATPLLSAVDVIDELIAKNPDYFIRESEPLVKIKVQDKKKFDKIEDKPRAKTEGLSEYEAEILRMIENGYKTQNQMEEKVSFDAARLTALLGMLEIKGIIKKGLGNKYTVNTGGGC